ncbi:cleavage stimulation factor subunit 2-like isoform X2 [Apostichopus japonicus]|uniref:cleavage stimulation factor subunit 2-like isoform X2 n=1 Tax=Stichopus japonicus TaxID=307972 RepID=UPI003AB63487
MSASDKSQRSVFVGNIPYDTSEEKLKDIFSEVGPVLSFRLVYDRDTGKPKGYGFCEYQDEETALSAMRNLNGYDINGRALRVDYATTEKNKEEMKALQLAQAPLESPFGDVVVPHEAPEAISKAVASLPPEQMFELMKQMKIVIQNNPVEARNMLLQNPQLAYALLQAQVVMRIVSPEVAMTLLHKQNDAPQPILPPEQQPGSSQGQPQAVAPPQVPQPIPPPPSQLQQMSAAQPNHGGRGPHGDLRGPEPGLVPQRTGPGPVLPGGLQGRQGPQAGIPGLMQQQGGLNEGRFPDGRGPSGNHSLMNQGQPPSGGSRQGPGAHGMMMMHPGEPGRGGIPGDHGGPMEQDPFVKDQGRRGNGQNPLGMPPRQGGMDPRGPMDARGGPMEGRGGPMEGRGGPMEGRGGPMEGRGGPMEGRGGPMEGRGGPMEGRGGPMEGRGGPLDGIDPRRQGFERHPEGLSQVLAAGGLTARMQQLDPRAMQRGLPHLLPGVGSTVPLPGAVPGQAQPTPQDQEKAALIMQVLGLSNEQINSLPQDQRQSILLLKEQLARSQNQMP